MKRRSFLSLATLAFSSRALAAERSAIAVPFEFAVIGDIFSQDAGVAEASSLLSAIAATKAQLIIDVGSIKSDDERCSDELLEQRVALFNASSLPVVPVAASAEWLGCAQPKEGSFDPAERLDQLRLDLFATPMSLGGQPLALARESGMRQFRSFAENTRFEVERILFVTLNAPSPNNDYRFAGGRNGEFEDRVIANRAWIERAFRYAQMLALPGIVIAMEGDPEFSRPLRPPDHRAARRDGYYEIKLLLREEAARYHGQILLLHGSNAGFLIDQPLQDGAGHVIRNFTRVRALGAANANSWLEIKADAKAPRVLQVQKYPQQT
jgi:hypothetical protein